MYANPYYETMKQILNDVESLNGKVMSLLVF